MISWVKHFVALPILATILLSLAVQQAGADNSRQLTVVELFTSQGCSSCPPADAHLGELTEIEDVLALSFHVDYWDNLGWPDPYSSADNTRRQRSYAQHMDLRYVYTPQMVIQGALQATGSDRRAVRNQINQARKLPHVDIQLGRKDEAMLVNLPESTHPVKADVYMVVYDKEHTTQIKRGENRGKTITNRNVVRTLKRIGSWKGETMNLTSPLGETGDACAVIVQSSATGAILGAATVVLN